MVERTENAIEHEDDIAELFGSDFDPGELKETVVESIHEYVIETDIDSVETRKQAVSESLGMGPERASSD